MKGVLCMKAGPRDAFYRVVRGAKTKVDPEVCIWTDHDVSRSVP